MGEIYFNKSDFIELALKYIYQKHTNFNASTCNRELEIIIDGEVIDYMFELVLKEDSLVNANDVLLTNIRYIDNSEDVLCLYDNVGNRNNVLPVAIIDNQDGAGATVYITTSSKDGNEIDSVDIDLIISKE